MADQNESTTRKSCAADGKTVVPAKNDCLWDRRFTSSSLRTRTKSIR